VPCGRRPSSCVRSVRAHSADVPIHRCGSTRSVNPPTVLQIRIRRRQPYPPENGKKEGKRTLFLASRPCISVGPQLCVRLPLKVVKFPGPTIVRAGALVDMAHSYRKRSEKLQVGQAEAHLEIPRSAGRSLALLDIVTCDIEQAFWRGSNLVKGRSSSAPSRNSLIRRTIGKRIRLA